MKIIPVGDDHYAKVDDEDFDKLSIYHWLIHDGTYACRMIGKRRIYMHREIMNAPRGKVVDHRNRDGLDNRKENLRLGSQSQNLGNSKSRRGSSKYKGVSWYARTQRWQAHLMKDGKSIGLGYFMVEEDAAKAYDAKAREVFGEYARTNF